MREFVLTACLAAWILFTAGFCLIGTGLEIAVRFKKMLWNGRIEKMEKPPFSVFLRVYGERHYLKSFLMVLVCNIPGHLRMFLLGCVKIGAIMILVQPFMQGAVVGMGDDKTRIWGVFTAVFEVSGFVVSCCLGIWGRIDLWWISGVLLLLNAAAEAGGTLAGVTGVPGIRAVKNREFIE